MQVVVYGAGAVGSVLGGMLSVNHHDVLLVGRQQLAQAVEQHGLRLKSATGEYVAHPRVVASLSPQDLAAGGCVLLTVKRYDVESAVAELAGIIPVDTPIVCFQNGMGAEAIAATRFSRVHGGVVRMTCSMLQPGNASFRGLGRVIVGVHPKGSDAFTRSLALAFRAAGFEAVSSRTIESDEWLKLALNTQTVVHAAVDARDHDSNEFQELNASILDETRRVFKAAKIKARSCDGRDPSIEDMIAELRRPRARRTDHGVKVHNSLWQDLYLKRDRIESEYIHGPVIELGREHGVPTPFNSAMLETALRLHTSGLGPEKLRLSELLEAVARLQPPAPGKP
jgi:2-dehydropantoate 2-reductase